MVSKHNWDRCDDEEDLGVTILKRIQDALSNINNKRKGRFKASCHVKPSEKIKNLQNIWDHYVKKLKSGELQRNLSKNINFLFGKQTNSSKYSSSHRKDRYDAIRQIYEENIRDLEQAREALKTAREIERVCNRTTSLDERNKCRELACELRAMAHQKQINSFKVAERKLKTLEKDLSSCYNEPICVQNMSLSTNNCSTGIHNLNRPDKKNTKECATQCENIMRRRPHSSRVRNVSDIIIQHMSTCDHCKVKENSRESYVKPDYAELYNSSGTESFIGKNPRFKSYKSFDDFNTSCNNSQKKYGLKRTYIAGPGADQNINECRNCEKEIFNYENQNYMSSCSQKQSCDYRSQCRGGVWKDFRNTESNKSSYCTRNEPSQTRLKEDTFTTLCKETFNNSYCYDRKIFQKGSDKTSGPINSGYEPGSHCCSKVIEEVLRRLLKEICQSK